MSRRRYTAAALAVIAFATGPLVATARPAHAAYDSVISSTGGRYYCIDLDLSGCKTKAGDLVKGTAVHMWCWKDAAKATTGAYSTKRWFYVTASSGVRGFVHASRVSKESQRSTPSCDGHVGISAARWAAEQHGETRPSAAEKRESGMDRWSGWCYAFAQDAFIIPSRIQPEAGHGSAKATYYEYERRKLVKKNLDHKIVDIGSIVFWTRGTYGHAAIYVGQGMVATTVGDGTAFPPNDILPMSKFGTPAGWVAPANVKAG